MAKDESICKLNHGVEITEDLSALEWSAANKLRAAAAAVGDSAYDLAGAQPSIVISQLIIICADLERLATLIDGRSVDN